MNVWIVFHHRVCHPTTMIVGVYEDEESAFCHRYTDEANIKTRNGDTRVSVQKHEVRSWEGIG